MEDFFWTHSPQIPAFLTGIQLFPTNQQCRNYQKVYPYGIQRLMKTLCISESNMRGYTPMEAPHTEHKSRSPRNCNMLGNRKIRGGCFNPCFAFSIDIILINHDILKQVEVSKRKGNRCMKSGLSDNRQPLSHQPKRRATYGAENLRQDFT